MSLRLRITLVLAIAFLLLAGGIHLVQSRILYPSFVALEDRQATTDMSRVMEGINREIDHLQVLCIDWAAWDNCYDFITQDDAGFREANLVYGGFKNNKVDLMVFLEREGGVRWSGRRDDATQSLVAADDVVAELLACPAAFPPPLPGAKRTGILLTSRGPMLVAANRIVRSSGEGPVRGTLVMGRLLDDEAIAQISSRTRVALTSWRTDRPLPAEEAGHAAALSADRPMEVDRGHAGVVWVYALQPGIDGRPALLLRAEVPAETSAEGARATRYAVRSAMAGGLLIVGFMWLLIDRLMVRPLRRLARHAGRVAGSDDLSARLNMRRRDEIGRLAREFDHMVERLAASQARMIDSAHQAGMAQIASEVLHNVGNALNTVNATTEVMAERARVRRADGLAKAVSLMRAHRDDLPAFLAGDERGRKLPGYLERLSGVLAEEQTLLAADLRTLQDRVGHIRDVIRVQQDHASAREFEQEFEVAELVEDALSMHHELLTARGVRVTRAYRAQPRVRLARPRLLQVMVNLIKNGIEAMDDTGRPRELRVRVDAEAGRAVVRIADSGAGIAAAERARLFESGFTTKPTGHGFGLHYCANALKKMGGTIDAESDGPGTGACFVLTLPTTTEEEGTEHEACAN